MYIIIIIYVRICIYIKKRTHNSFKVTNTFLLLRRFHIEKTLNKKRSMCLLFNKNKSFFKIL